ncbi:MAG: transposase, partial [Anaerolineae bacterium]|nr:transposase [Anaerolineae bacterium]
FKDLLIEYNREDCQAAKLLADKIQEIAEKAELQPNIDFIDNPKKRADDIDNEIHDQFKAILEFAHEGGYEKKKIAFEHVQKDSFLKNQAQQENSRSKPQEHLTDIVQWNEPPEICPKCNQELRACKKKISDRILVDLCMTEGGYSRKITKIQSFKGYCKNCQRYFGREDLKGGVIFGHGFQSWVIYERMALRLPHRIIIDSLKEQFGEKVRLGFISITIKQFANLYADTNKLLLERVLTSPFIHADETKVNVQGQECYAWVFTNGNHVVLKMTETREASFVTEFLKDYKGILISDFYSAYDSLSCTHQKCLVHLIRDMNDDLWKSPFDYEYQGFIREFKNLIVPIIKTVHLQGLSKLYLSGFSAEIDIFFEKHIFRTTYESESALKYQKRLKKYKDSLFTFIHYDGIPWNNNMAERAFRHLVIQENISKTFFKTMFPDHLALLGIMQTCRFQQKSFLKFLISGQKDVDAYHE